MILRQGKPSWELGSSEAWAQRNQISKASSRAGLIFRVSQFCSGKNFNFKSINESFRAIHLDLQVVVRSSDLIGRDTKSRDSHHPMASLYIKVIQKQ